MTIETENQMRYEIQHYTLLYGWINMWLCPDENGGLQPETFATREEAQAALDEYLEDIAEEAAAGQMEPHDPDEFRVRSFAVPVLQHA